MASLDAYGHDVNLLHLPVGAAGSTFHMAFLALRPSQALVVPSPALRIDVL